MPAKKELVKKGKGMKDILPEECLLREKFVDKAKAIAEFYGFEPIQTPYLEKVELFTSAIGESTDIVEKEMYNLKTKGGEKLVLRPEGTAPIVRAYLENGMHTKPQPVMLYYSGSFFRYERPQKGRRREHQQFGIEVLGEEDSIADALVIRILFAILEEATGIKSFSLRLNSVGDKECRKNYQKELTAYYRKHAKSLCKNCERRLKTNPLRLLDCKEEECAPIKEDAPQIIDYLCNSCTNHFKELLEILDASGTPYYLDHHLVRGLDYYSRTAFEFVSEEGLAFGGGGRYDPLAEIISGKELPGVGGSIGVERALETKLEKQRSESAQKPIKVFFIQLGTGAKHKSLYVLEMLRKAKIPAKHSLSKNSIKSQLAIASKLGASYTLIFGQKEALENSIIIRDMETASQETVNLEKLTDYLKKKI
ncbi:histidine--tRNA ligase [Patescibacteria group bacterium]|nr:histidine--tRNA ligase [Patescibacteria group bacterium]